MHDFKTENRIELKFKHAQALHGDVIIEKVASLPSNFLKMEKSKDGALAYGEVTGHSHKLFRMHEDGAASGSLAFDLRTDKNGIKFLKVEAPTELRHQEHNPRIIPPGDYVIKIQREYDPFTKLARQVAD